MCAKHAAACCACRRCCRARAQQHPIQQACSLSNHHAIFDCNLGMPAGMQNTDACGMPDCMPLMLLHVLPLQPYATPCLFSSKRIPAAVLAVDGGLLVPTEPPLVRRRTEWRKRGGSSQHTCNAVVAMHNTMHQSLKMSLSIPQALPLAGLAHQRQHGSHTGHQHPLPALHPHTMSTYVMRLHTHLKLLTRQTMATAVPHKGQQAAASTHTTILLLGADANAQMQYTTTSWRLHTRNSLIWRSHNVGSACRLGRPDQLRASIGQSAAAACLSQGSTESRGDGGAHGKLMAGKLQHIAGRDAPCHLRRYICQELLRLWTDAPPPLPRGSHRGQQ